MSEYVRTNVHIQSCPTLCDAMDCSPPGSSVHRISQARILEQVAISYSRGYSRARDYLLHCRQIFLMLRVPLPFPFVVVYFPKIQTRFILFFSVGCVVIVEEPRSFVWLNSSQFGSVGGRFSRVSRMSQTTVNKFCVFQFKWFHYLGGPKHL